MRYAVCSAHAPCFAIAAHRSQARKAALERISGSVSGCLRRVGCLPLAAAVGAATAWCATAGAAAQPASDVITRRFCSRQTLQGERRLASMVVPRGGRLAQVLPAAARIAGTTHSVHEHAGVSASAAAGPVPVCIKAPPLARRERGSVN